MKTTGPDKKKTEHHRIKKVFICSPLRPQGATAEEKEKSLYHNGKLAQAACRYAVMNGYIPHAPHLFFPQFLDDTDETERECGRLMGLTWLLSCNELWVIGRRISKGMQREIDKAEKWGIPVRRFVGRRQPEDQLLDELLFPDIAFEEMT